MGQLRAFSFGGGVQSTAALVLAAQGKIDYPIFLFANVGDDSEHPATLKYVHEVAMPYAKEHDIELVELRKTISRGPRKGQQETILGRIMRPDSKTQVIPVFLSGSGAPANRGCTHDFKIRVLARYLKQQGAAPNDPAIVGLGISVDEFQRMRTDSGIAWQKLDYPLIDLRMTRADCAATIRAAGLPVPPKSSCWFCPFHSTAAWRRLKNDRPDLFVRAVELEQHMNGFAALRGDAVYLTRTLQPLDQAVAGAQHEMDFDDDACESGFCMT
jgi:hypothetical protein